MFWFKTFPSITESWSPSFAIYGDMGNKNAVSLPALQRETQSGTYDMILHIGDFAYDMHNVITFCYYYTKNPCKWLILGATKTLHLKSNHSQ